MWIMEKVTAPTAYSYHSADQRSTSNVLQENINISFANGEGGYVQNSVLATTK